jgi:hypothetical protein
MISDLLGQVKTLNKQLEQQKAECELLKTICKRLSVINEVHRGILNGHAGMNVRKPVYELMPCECKTLFEIIITATPGLVGTDTE